ncbi:NALCN channel auxiliary factor 1-like [Brachionichthys hirsutus]|uniref:NALCN channel auxiliary factor 1-like n=1 Tax=Brachionichthys hirsutus TaxID=412623 RepID=UPI0036045B9C
MTRGAWMRRQHDEGFRGNEKPFAESERAQRWRLSLASLLFITVLLSDHLWFCAEAKLTRTRDKRPDEEPARTDMAERPDSLRRPRIPTSPEPPHRLAGEQGVIFLGNSTLWRMDTCHPDSLSKDCFTFTDARTVCLGLSGGSWDKGAQLAYVNLSDLYLSFCNSYSLLDLFYGFTSPGVSNCTLNTATGADQRGCRECVRAYQHLDQDAEKKYREFELLVQKYETDAYSVRTCMQECKVSLTRPWLCSEPLQRLRSRCSLSVVLKQGPAEGPAEGPSGARMIFAQQLTFECRWCQALYWEFSPD